jgi:endonuclease/exonuclease/phosphatase (EEP) superfamily protein YafD
MIFQVIFNLLNIVYKMTTLIIQYWKEMVITLFAGLCAISIAYSFAVRNENVRLRETLETAKSSLRSLEQNMRAQTEALQKRAQAQSSIDQNKQADQVRLNTTLQTDPPSDEWASKPIPSEIMKLLKNE